MTIRVQSVKTNTNDHTLTILKPFTSGLTINSMDHPSLLSHYIYAVFFVLPLLTNQHATHSWPDLPMATTNAHILNARFLGLVIRFMGCISIKIFPSVTHVACFRRCKSVTQHFWDENQFLASLGVFFPFCYFLSPYCGFIDLLSIIKSNGASNMYYVVWFRQFDWFYIAELHLYGLAVQFKSCFLRRDWCGSEKAHCSLLGTSWLNHRVQGYVVCASPVVNLFNPNCVNSIFDSGQAFSMEKSIRKDLYSVTILMINFTALKPGASEPPAETVLCYCYLQLNVNDTL